MTGNKTVASSLHIPSQLSSLVTSASKMPSSSLTPPSPVHSSSHPPLFSSKREDNDKHPLPVPSQGCLCGRFTTKLFLTFSHLHSWVVTHSFIHPEALNFVRSNFICYNDKLEGIHREGVSCISSSQLDILTAKSDFTFPSLPHSRTEPHPFVPIRLFAHSLYSDE